MTPQEFCPFAVPAPQFHFVGKPLFAEGESDTWDLATLKDRLLSIGTWYLDLSQEMGVGPLYEQRRAFGAREANLSDFIQTFRAVKDSDRFRSLVLARYGSDLSFNLVNRLIADLVRTSGGSITVTNADRMTLGEAAEKIDQVGNPTTFSELERHLGPSFEPIRNWLVAHYLNDPMPECLAGFGDGEMVFEPYAGFGSFLVSLGVDVLATLDACKSPGWIEDVRIDLTPTDGPGNADRLPLGIRRLNLPEGRHRLVGIRSAVLSARPALPQREVAKRTPQRSDANAPIGRGRSEMVSLSVDGVEYAVLEWLASKLEDQQPLVPLDEVQQFLAGKGELGRLARVYAVLHELGAVTALEHPPVPAQVKEAQDGGMAFEAGKPWTVALVNWQQVRRDYWQVSGSAALLARQLRERPAGSATSESDSLVSTYRRVLTDTIPAATHFLELGQHLRDASLFHFLKDKLPQRTDPEKYAANLLYAAARYHQLEGDKEAKARVRDDQFIVDRLAEIGRRQLWGEVRAELAKLLKLIVSELESRNPPRRCPKCGRELWPKAAGGYCPTCDLQEVPSPYDEAEAALREWANIETVGGKFRPGWTNWLAICERDGVAPGGPNHWVPIIQNYWKQLMPGRELGQDTLVTYLFSAHDIPPDKALAMELTDLARRLKAASEHALTPPTVPAAPSRAEQKERNRSSDAGTGQPAPQAELTAVERALIVFTRDPSQSLRKVAREVGCDPSLLSRDDRFKRLRQAHAGSIRKGKKSKEGDVEAEDE